MVLITPANVLATCLVKAPVKVLTAPLNSRLIFLVKDPALEITPVRLFRAGILVKAPVKVLILPVTDVRLILLVKAPVKVLIAPV